MSSSLSGSNNSLTWRYETLFERSFLFVDIRTVSRHISHYGCSEEVVRASRLEMSIDDQCGHFVDRRTRRDNVINV